MKLSKKEERVAKQPRSIDEMHLHHNGHKITVRDLKMDHAIHFIVKQYAHNCTITFDEISGIVMEKFSVTKENVLEYLRASLENKETEFDKYFQDPDMLFRHIAYLSTFHQSKSTFFRVTLRLTEENTLACLSESVLLLMEHPNLSQKALENILTYRVGVSHEVIHNCLNSTIEESFSPKIQTYLKNLQLEKDNTLFDLCKKRAAFLERNSVHILNL